MRYVRACLVAAVALLIVGCASMIRPESPEPKLYRLDYKPAAIDCSRGFERKVRVTDFMTASPYNRTQMVVLSPGRQVMFSRNFQWVSNPGVMLADQLRSDLKPGGLFPGVSAAGDLGDVPLEMTGEILKFACERTDSQCEAVLGVDVQLRKTGGDRKTVFRNTYNLRSRPFDKADSAEFAGAMSRLAGRFSEKLRQDLCEAAGTARQIP